MAFSGGIGHNGMMRSFFGFFALSLGGLGAAAGAQQLAPAMVEQITPSARNAAPVSSAPRGPGDRAASADGVAAARRPVAPTPSPDVLACRDALAEDREPPEGVDCLAVLQQYAEAEQAAAPPRSGEGNLLEIFYGQSSEVTNAPALQSGPGLNADAVARQLSTGDVQANPGSDAAIGAIRQRGGPPPGGGGQR